MLVDMPTFLVFFGLLQLCVLRQYLKHTKMSKDKTKYYKKKQASIISMKKSSEIRLGKIGENMAPFMKGWPYDPNRFRFVGSPVDGLQFTDNEIIFIEIKTGKSKLNSNQKLARDLIRRGKVSFATFRVDETGTQLRKEIRREDGTIKIEKVEEIN